jgi:hypothetical protein
VIRGTEVGAVAEPDKGQQDMTRYHELAKAALADAGQDPKGGGGASAGGIGWGGEEYESAGDKQARRFRKRLERAPQQVALALGARPPRAARPRTRLPPPRVPPGAWSGLPCALGSARPCALPLCHDRQNAEQARC